MRTIASKAEDTFCACVCKKKLLKLIWDFSSIFRAKKFHVLYIIATFYGRQVVCLT
jgi:hypothetical protein